MTDSRSLEQAKELLLQDKVQNRYPLLRLAQGGVGECWIRGGSVCLWDKEHNKYIYAVRSADELRQLHGQVRERKGELVSLLTDDAWADTARALEDGLLVNHCTQLLSVPYEGTPPALPDIRLGEVTKEVAEWILTVYEHPELSVEFILRRAAAAPAVAAFCGDRPVGFFLTHSNAELGPVYVDPAYRSRGLADALYAQMASRLPRGDAAPVLFVFPSNHASQKWLRRLGCVPTPKQVAWFWRDTPTSL